MRVFFFHDTLSIPATSSSASGTLKKSLNGYDFKVSFLEIIACKNCNFHPFFTIFRFYCSLFP
jgi:hypothetical protein